MKSRGTHRRVIAVALILSSVLVGLVLCEAVLRVFVAWSGETNPHSFVSFMRRINAAPRDGDSLFCPSADALLGYELVPGTARGHIRINSGGFRGPETSCRPPAGTKRIIVIGDSETFAEKLKEEDTFPGALQRRLNANPGNRRYEVLNFGVPGYNTIQERRLLETKAIHYRPDAVILYYVMNDPATKSYAVLTHSLFGRSHLVTFLLYITRFSADVDDALRETYLRAGGYPLYFQKLHQSELWEPCAKNLREMGTYLSARDIDFTIVISPELFGFPTFEEFPHQGIHGLLHALQSECITVIDPLQAVADIGKTPRELWVTPTDPHKSAEAIWAVSGEVTDWLLKDGQVEAPHSR